MRMLPLIAVAALTVCACGQKGPLVLPPKPVATPVVIRAPAEAPPPAAEPQPEQKDDSQPPAPPKH